MYIEGFKAEIKEVEKMRICLTHLIIFSLILGYFLLCLYIRIT